MQPFIAHVRSKDRSIQTVEQHLQEVSLLSGIFAEKIGLKKTGELIGLLHDFGKYSKAFQKYIRANTAEILSPVFIDFDIDECSFYKKQKGRIDHSTAGAQWIKSKFPDKTNFKHLCVQLMSLAVVSHHGGLIDCIDVDGKNKYETRLNKADKDTHFNDCRASMPDSIRKSADDLINSNLSDEIYPLVISILSPKSHQFSNKVKEFHLGLAAKFLFSCLVDADRISSADYEAGRDIHDRLNTEFSWDLPVSIFESHIKTFNNSAPINQIRKTISDQCFKRSSDKQGIYTLTVPTGGGKTLSSFRYALHHAKKHNLDRIIYIIPYTSIIEQNAGEIRNIFSKVSDEYSLWVLEHHSNLEPENQSWQSKLFAENWDAPIVFTTMVQFLEACFGGGTRGARRLHQLANSLLIFDEIQTLPIKCVHMFCNLLNFLYLYAGTTAILCTATQPVLDNLTKSEKGQLILSTDHEIIGLSCNVKKLFTDLERVNLIDLRRKTGWSVEDLTEFIIERFDCSLSCLVIVNTKQWAYNLYKGCVEKIINKDSAFHLSTNQCSAHRKTVFKKIRDRLKNNEPVLCISTQLIEAGVDISFKNVVRFVAGLDSIAQAAGRCNRHAELVDAEGLPQKGEVYIVNPDKEPILRLEDIAEGQKATSRILSENKVADLLSPECIKQYFKYYFYERADAMAYSLGYGLSLLNMLSDNEGNNYPHKNQYRVQNRMCPLLMQSFSEAGRRFSVFDAPTKSFIAPFNEEAKHIISELCLESESESFKQNLKDAQKFSVNVFPNVWKKLLENGAIHEIRRLGVYYLDECYYSAEFGLTGSGTGQSDLLIG